MVSPTRKKDPVSLIVPSRHARKTGVYRLNVKTDSTDDKWINTGLTRPKIFKVCYNRGVSET